MKRKPRVSAARPKVRRRNAAGGKRIGGTGRRIAAAKSGRAGARRAGTRPRTAVKSARSTRSTRSTRRKAAAGAVRSRSSLASYNEAFDAAYNEGFNAGFAEGFQAEQVK